MNYDLHLHRDDHGQPLRPFPYQRENNVNKAFEQLSGVCQGILADGVVNEAEAQFFWQWLQRFHELRSEWPFCDVIGRVNDIYSDGVVTEEERDELAEVMRMIIGGENETIPSELLSTTLPIETHLPEALVISEMEFVLTGKFALGTRKKVSASIQALGGLVRDGSPSKSTDYLIIGVFVSRDWISTNYGRKIEYAVQLRTNGGKIRIFPESFLKQFLG